MLSGGRIRTSKPAAVGGRDNASPGTLPGLFFYPIAVKPSKTLYKAFLLLRGINTLPTPQTPHREPQRATERATTRTDKPRNEQHSRPAGFRCICFGVGFRRGRWGSPAAFRPPVRAFVRLCAFLFVLNNAFNIPLFKLLCVLCVPKRIVRSQYNFLFIRIAEIVFHKEDAGHGVNLAVLHIIDHLKIE